MKKIMILFMILLLITSATTVFSDRDDKDSRHDKKEKKETQNNGKPFQEIWDAINDLSKKVSNTTYWVESFFDVFVQIEPYENTTNLLEQRIANLEARIASLEECSCNNVEVCGNSWDDDGDGLIDMADPGCSSKLDNDESDEISERGGTGGAGTDKVSVGVSVSPGFGATPKGTASVDVTSTVGEVSIEANYKVTDSSGNVVYTESDLPVKVSGKVTFEKVFDFIGSGLADLPSGPYTLIVEATENGVVVGSNEMNFAIKRNVLESPSKNSAFISKPVVVFSVIALLVSLIIAGYYLTRLIINSRRIKSIIRR